MSPKIKLLQTIMRLVLSTRNDHAFKRFSGRKPLLVPIPVTKRYKD